MKTKKALKITSTAQGMFCLGAVVSMVCMYLYYSTGEGTLGTTCFELGSVLAVLTAINPVAPICLAVNLWCYLSDRKYPSERKEIGKLWILIPVWPVVTTVLWYLTICVFMYYGL